MNQLIKTALDRLIQDETFRGELASMLDDVNRATQDPDLISRAEDDAPPPPEESPFSDVKADLLGDTAFLKALMDALMSINTADTERATQLNATIEQLQTTVTALQATLGEHDKVLTDLAEKVIIRESEQPRTVRARQIVKETDENRKPDLSDRAAIVLSRIGVKPNGA